MELAACGRNHYRDCLWIGCLMELGACGGNHSRSCWSILSCLSSETQVMSRMIILSCWIILSYVAFDDSVSNLMPCNSSTIMKAMPTKPAVQEPLCVRLSGPMTLKELRKHQDELRRQRKLKALQK